MEKIGRLHVLALMTLHCVGLCASLHAEEIAFPGSDGGDLSDSAAWGGRLPGDGDVALIGTPSKKYTISNDVTFSNIYFSSKGSYKVTSGDGVKVKLLDDKYPLRMIEDSAVEKRYVTLSGGEWDIGGHEWKGVAKNNFAYLSDGCVMTNVACCWVTSLKHKNARLILQNGSRLHCGEFRIGQTGAGSGAIEIASGSEVFCDGTFYTDTGAEKTDGEVGTRITVHGEGSSLECGLLYMGYKSSGHSLFATNGATVECTELKLGNGSFSCGNVIALKDSTLRISGDLSIAAIGSDPSKQSVFAVTNSTVAIGGDFKNLCRNSILDFQDADLSCAGNIQLFHGYGGSTVRFGGSNGVQSETLKTYGDYFNAEKSFNHTLIVDDGFVFEHNSSSSELMSDSSNCVLRVCGGAKFVSPYAVYMGDKDKSTSVSNRIEVVDGGRVELSRLYLIGNGNSLVVDNGTVVATDASDGLLLGYRGSGNTEIMTSGAKVMVKGATPKLESKGTIWLHSDTNVKVEIPKSGYPQNVVPFSASTIVFDTTSRIELDYAAFCASGGGELTLMSFAKDVREKRSADRGDVLFADWVAMQNELMALPSGCRLYVEGDGNTSQVKFRARPPVGARVIVR